MKKVVAYAIGGLLVVAGVSYWLGVQREQPAQLANPASAHCVRDLGGELQIRDEAGGQVGYCHLQDGSVCEEWALMRDGTCMPPADALQASADTECHDSPDYFVIVRARGTDTGSDILAKRKTSADEILPCVYEKSDGDIELADAGPTYFLGIVGYHLLLDHGTAPPPRGLTVYDLKMQKEVYADTYSPPTELATSTLTYWQPMDTKPTAENCPDLAQWQTNGLGAGIERHVALDLATLKVYDLGDTRCSARQ